jgi:hypothetical protein
VSMDERHVFLILSVSCLMGAGAVHAQHSVSVVAGVERIENPLLSSTSTGGVTVLRVEPSYALESQDGRTRSRLSLGAVLERSSNTGLVASRNYPRLGYTWDYSWPTSSLELRANVAEATTRNTQLEELGRITVDSRERSVVAGGRWSQDLAARTQLALDLTNTHVSYDSVLLSGYRELQVSSRVSWEANERLIYYFEPAVARLVTSGASTETTRKRWLAGVLGELAPGWSVTSFVGQARTSGPISVTGNVGGLQLDYAGSRLASGIEWSRDVAPSAVTNTYVRSEFLALRLGYQITDRATLSARMTRSQSDGIGGSRGQVSSLALENELGAQWSATLGIEDRRTQLLGGASGTGTAIRATFVYAHPGR